MHPGSTQPSVVNISLVRLTWEQCCELLSSTLDLSGTPAAKGIADPIRQKGVDNLRLQPQDGRPQPAKLRTFLRCKIYSYQWSQDGKNLAFVRAESPSGLVLIQEGQK